MQEFDFELKFKIKDEQNPSKYIDKLFENGCDDSTISINNIGYICLNFTRKAINKNEAIKSAVNDVQKTIPNALLIKKR